MVFKVAWTVSNAPHISCKMRVKQINKQWQSRHDEEEKTFTALKLTPKWRVVLDATSVSAYLQSDESTEKCGMDANCN
jgi:hypothetical protein